MQKKYNVRIEVFTVVIGMVTFCHNRYILVLWHRDILFFTIENFYYLILQGQVTQVKL